MPQILGPKGQFRVIMMGEDVENCTSWPCAVTRRRCLGIIVSSVWFNWATSAEFSHIRLHAVRRTWLLVEVSFHGDFSLRIRKVSC